MSNELLQFFDSGKIISDIYSENPDKSTIKYAEAIVETIKNSEPQYSIGIYGEWGTGKTTLMKQIYKSLQDEKNESIIPVWFNAWRYEREKQFALFPLLQTIANSIPETKDNKNLKEGLKKFAIGFGKGLLKSTPEIVSSFIPFMNKVVKTTAENITEQVGDQFLSFMDQINEKIFEDSLYANEIENLEKTLKEVRNNHKDFKIIIFIDDLDRCSPNKALEIFESIKVFLDLKGFVYVIGLTNQSISRFITPEEYGYEGKEYFKKLIQIPLNVPKWDTERIVSLIKEYLNIKYENINNNFEQVNLIAYAVKNNPRELVRFLNNIQLSRNIHKKSRLDLDKFLILQTIIERWSDFYYNLMYLNDNELKILHKKLEFLNYHEKDINDLNKELSKEIEEKLNKARKALDEIEIQSNIDQDIKIVINLIRENRDLLYFMFKYYDKIFDILLDKRGKYEEAVESINKSSLIINSEMEKEIALNFLNDKKINEFNKIRKMYEKLEIKLNGSDLAGLDLSGVNLRYSELSDSDLSDSVLSNSYLYNSNLKNCDLTDTDMSNTNLSYSGFTNAYMIRANLQKSYMLNTIMKNVYLQEGNLEEADLSGSEICDSDLENANLTGSDLRYTNFIDTKLDNSKFIGANLDHVKIINKLTSNNIKNADFSDAKLTNAIIITDEDTFNFKYNQNTDFKDSIIDNPSFIDYIKITSNKAKNIPEKIKNKIELKNKLEKRIKDMLEKRISPIGELNEDEKEQFKKEINDLVKLSKLPEIEN